MTAAEQPIEAICLDLDDTLWPVLPVIQRAERAMLDWLQANYPDISRRFPRKTLRQRLAQILERFPEQKHDMSFVRRNLLGEITRQAGHPPGVAEQAYQVFFEERNRVDLYQDVLPALEWLSARFPLVAVTNGNADLNRVGLGQYFVASIQAREIGVAKPEREIFDVAVQRTGVAHARVLHVGDDPHTDVHGAHQAGMQAAWVNRKGENWQPESPPPRMIVSDLEELSIKLGRSGERRD